MKKTTIDLIEKLGFSDRTDVSIEESIVLRRPEDGFTIEVRETETRNIYLTFNVDLNDMRDFFDSCSTLRGYLKFAGHKTIPTDFNNDYLSNEISSINMWDGYLSGSSYFMEEDDLVQELEQKYKVSADIEYEDEEV
jgi:hypothetical protein